MLSNRLILFEGLPGTGKSTLAKKTYEFLTSRDIPATFYNEGQLHPADLSWCACVPLSDLPAIFQTYPAYEAVIKEHMSLESDYAVIPYTQLSIKSSDQALYDLFAGYEIYDAHTSTEVFKQKHYDRWERFGIEAAKQETHFIFECALLQNHINELLLFHNQTDQEITLHILHLIELVKNLNPILIYLNPTNIAATTEAASKERSSPSGIPEWQNRVCDWLEHSPYGELHSLTGLCGLLSYLKTRKHLEEKIMHALPIPCYILYNDTHDWVQITDKIHKILLQSDAPIKFQNGRRIKL